MGAFPAGRRRGITDSCCRPAVEMCSPRPTGLTSSASIAAVDVDIAVRQIAGPHGGDAASQAKIDGDLHFPPLHVLYDGRFIISGHHAAIARLLCCASSHREPVT